MSEIKKVNAGCAVNKVLALSVQGQDKISQSLQANQAGVDKVTGIYTAIKEKEDVVHFFWFFCPWILLCPGNYQLLLLDLTPLFLGVAMVFHGAQFKNLFLCIQLIKSFYYDRLSESIGKLQASVTTALDKMKADAPDAAAADAKSEAKPDNKKAAKAGASEKSTEENAAAAKKALKAMDSAQLSNTAFEVCSAAMAAHMVMHTRLGQAIVLAHHLVKVAMEQIEKFVDFAGLEDLFAWTTLFLRFAFYCTFIGLALIAAPWALALDASVFGAQLVLQGGAVAAHNYCETYGKLPLGLGEFKDADGAFVSSKNGMKALAGITAFGTFWQFWTLMSGGMAWYVQLLYLPAVIAEAVVGCF